jgi:hypothetical protein
MRAGSVIAVCVVGLATPACFDATVGDAVLACEATSDCPEPLFCDGGRCRRGTSGDTTPPGVVGGSARLDANVIRPGASTSLVFTATEALSETPRFSGDDLGFRDVGSDGDGLAVDVTAGNFASEGRRDISVVLVDVAGNASDELFVATLFIDTTPPVVQSSVVPELVAPGAPITMDVEANEAISTATFTLTPAFGAAVEVPGAVADATASCGNCAVFDASATAVGVSVLLVDLAGNDSTTDLGSIAIFGTP